MDARISSLVDILRLNTRLFRRCLDGFTDLQAAERPTSGTNNAAFIAAHLSNSRFYLLKLLGVERENPLARYLAAARTIDDVKEYPSVAETLSAWSDVSHALRDRLEAITAPALDDVVSPRFQCRTRRVWPPSDFSCDTTAITSANSRCCGSTRACRR